MPELARKLAKIWTEDQMSYVFCCVLDQRAWEDHTNMSPANSNTTI